MGSDAVCEVERYKQDTVGLTWNQTPREGLDSLLCWSCPGSPLCGWNDGETWWKEHFEELLNPTKKSSEVEAESEDPGEYVSISLAEIAGVVKKIPCSKAPQVDEIRPEILTALDIVGLSWHTSSVSCGGLEPPPLARPSSHL